MRNNPNTVQVVTQTRAPGSSTWEVSSNTAVLLEVGDSGYHKFTPGANLVFCDMAMDDDKNLYVASASQWENSYTSNGHVFKITPNKSGDYAVGCGTISVIANNIPSPISIDVNSRQQVFVSSHAAYDGFASSVGGVFIIDNGDLQLIANGSYYIGTSGATSTTANIYGGRYFGWAQLCWKFNINPIIYMMDRYIGPQCVGGICLRQIMRRIRFLGLHQTPLEDMH